jgi:hypothetical protein
MLGLLPGMSLEDAVKREIVNRQYTDDRSKSTNYNWQDKFGGFLGGYTRADVEREMQKQLDRDVRKKYNRKYADTAERLGDQLNPLYTGKVKGLTEAEIEKQQAQDVRRATNLETLKLIPGNESLTLNPNASSTALQGLITTATDNRRLELNREQEGKQAKIYARADEKEARLRADALRQQMRQDKQTEANRAQQFQIQQMQLGLENRRLDMQEARNFRQDRQKAIMQIMQGFQQMGNAFAY